MLKTRIRPKDINANQHMFNTFEHQETEVSAGWIVRFCQEENGNTWDSFPESKLIDYYQKLCKAKESFLFNRLTRDSFVVVDGKTRMVTVSNEFVRRCCKYVKAAVAEGAGA